VEHGPYAVVEHSSLQLYEEIILVFVIEELQIEQIFPFVGLSKTVDDENVLFPGLIKGPNDIAANESGSTGNYDQIFAGFHAYLLL
jgi:hypothetical protein